MTTTRSPSEDHPAGPVAEAIRNGECVLGIEFGSTRIKAVLTGPGHLPVASGSHAWENEYVDHVWTYSMDAVWAGLQGCVSDLMRDVQKRYGVDLTRPAALGISGMMHGYLALDEDDELLTPFRTWRNSGTGAATEALTDAFGVNIPHRWSVAHYYQAILDGEEHVARVAHLETLAGHVHRRLTGERVLGVGDASGMFPIDSATCDYDARMLARFDALAREHGVDGSLVDLLPTVLVAGQAAGTLTDEGARLLDPTGRLHSGAAMCPPEGDAGTGMVATNSIAPRTGNVSAGTSIFAMVVLERPLSAPHPEIDLVTTPAGDPVGMVHCNNGADEINAWARVFADFAESLGLEVEMSTVFAALFRSSLQADPDCGGLTAYNYLAGEPITRTDEGRPMLLRAPGGRLTLPNLMRAQIYAVFATLRLGMDVLQRDEGVRVERLFAHGGMFTTPGVAQSALAAAVGTPVTVGEIAAQGGPWGMALLAEYAVRGGGRSLARFLDDVFATADVHTCPPDADDMRGYEDFLTRFVGALPVQRAAIDHT